MKRASLFTAIALLSAGCFGACGGSEPTSGTSSGSTATTTTTTTSTGSDTTSSSATTDESTTSTSEPRIVVGDDPCTTDADCVPASCCHPTACVARAHAPDCGDSVCTSDCRYGTLDCGGGCLCQAGHCAARLSALPNIPGLSDVQ